MSVRPSSVVAMATQCWLSSVWNGWATGQRIKFLCEIDRTCGLKCWAASCGVCGTWFHTSPLKGFSFQLSRTLQYLTLSSFSSCVLLGRVVVGFGVGGWQVLYLRRFFSPGIKLLSFFLFFILRMYIWDMYGGGVWVGDTFNVSHWSLWSFLSSLSSDWVELDVWY